MTVNSTSNRVEYAGDGSSAVFSVGFYFLAAEDLKVYLRTAAGNEVLQTLTTDYTATGSGNPAGGSITMVTPPGIGEKLVIICDPALTQLTDYQANDAFPAETHERALDKLTMQAQRLSERIDRSVTLEETATSGDGAYDFGGNRISNVAGPIDNEDAANKEHVDNTLQLVNAASGDEAFSWVSASGVTGTVDAIILTVSALPSTPTAGFKVRFEPEGTNTGPVTVQLTDGTNTWPAIALVDRYLGALSGGALTDKVPTEITYSGAASRLVLNHDAGDPVVTVRDEFMGNGALVDFTMSVTPAADNDVQVFIDGVHQHPDDWSFSGTTLKFTEAPFDGAKIVARIGNQAGSAAVPADGSVTAAKLAGGSVGSPALIDGAVTPEKRTHRFFIAREQYDTVQGIAVAVGDNVRAFNTEVVDDFGTVTLSGGGAISGLPAGRYRVSGYTSKYAANQSYQIFLYNVTDAAIAIPGHAGYAGTGNGADAVSIPFSGVLDIAAGKIFELRQWSNAAYVNGAGFVSAKRADLDLVYAEITFERIGA